MQVNTYHIKKIVVIRVVSSPSYFIPFSCISLLIHSCHSSQTTFENLKQSHCTNIIYHSTILIKNFEKWLWNSSLFANIAACWAIFLFKSNSFKAVFKFLNHMFRTATMQKRFSKMIIFWEHLFVVTFCWSSRY